MQNGIIFKHKLFIATLCIISIILGSYFFFLIKIYSQEEKHLIKEINISMNYAGQLYEKYKTNSSELKQLWTSNTRNSAIDITINTPNLLENSDFELGDTLFHSSYVKLHDNASNFTPITDGWRTIGLRYDNFKKDWIGKGYGGQGKYLLLDGAATSNNIVWSQKVTVKTHCSYYLQFHLSTLSLDTITPYFRQWMLAGIEVTINGKIIANDLAPERLNTWKKIAGVWDSNNDTIATIEMRSINTSALFNDFGIDELSFKQIPNNLAIGVKDKTTLKKNSKIFDDLEVFKYLFDNQLKYNQIDGLDYQCTFIPNYLYWEYIEKRQKEIRGKFPENKYYELFNEMEAGEISTTGFSLSDSIIVFTKIKNFKSWIFTKLKVPLIAFGFMLVLSFGIIYMAYKWEHIQSLKFKQKTDLLNVIAHELKTPVAAISIALEALEKYKNKIDEEKSTAYLKESRLQTFRLQELVESVLQTLRVPEKTTLLKREHIDIDTIMLHCIQLFSGNSPDREINYINNSLTKSIYTDKLHLINVISNILENAIKYNTKKPIINITVTNSQKYHIITVEDNGIGVSPEDSKQLFEEFFRAPSLLLNQVKGFGLGLSYCKKILELQGGNINYKSKGDKGSIFIINLPLNYE